VLHVDDEEGFLALTRMFLEREGDIRVEGVGSAEIALGRLRENRYDAIVSDYQMPGMDGIAFLKQLRESGDATPFIILTGKGREQVAIEALNSGADFYLQKGTDPKIGFIELRNLILQAATHRHAVEALVESEKRLAEIIDFLPDATFAIDTTGRVIAWNQAIAVLTGVPAREMMGKESFEYAIPMYGERRPVLIDLVSEPPEGVMKYPYRDVRREGGVLTAETISARPRGRNVILWARASPLRNSRGETTGAIESVRDITEKKRAEAALLQSEERYRNLAEASRDLIYIIDRDDRVVYLNTRALELLGRRLEEVVGKPRGLLFPPETSESIMRNLGKVFSTGEPVRVENRIPIGDMETWQDTTLIPLRGPEGAVTCVMGISRDITERKEIDEALRESEERWKTLFERSAVPQLLMDGEVVIDCNAAFLALFSLQDKETVVGHSPGTFAPPVQPDGTPSLEKGREIQRTFLEKGSARYEWAHLKHDAARTPILTEVIGTVIHIHGRSLVHVIVLDITERRRIEDALRESEEKYRTVVERANDGIIVVQDGIIRFCNRRAAEFWGGDVRDILGKSYLDFIDPKDVPRIREQYERRMAGEENPRKYDTLLARRDGTRVPVEINAGIVTYDGRPADLVLFRDMTERVMAEESLRNANRKLNLLSSVTRHDLLNQIMVVTGYLELARDGTTIEEVKQLMELAGKAAVTMRRQVEFTRQYEDIGVRSPVWQDLREVIARALPGLAGRVKIQLDISRVSIYADPLLERVFTNLIENALIHGRKVTTIRFSARATDGVLTILCEDDGIGIPAREKEKIFAPAYGRNTGYGLFLVREILGITGATIREIGQEGKGATFEITIPGDAYRVGG
jgi:PAS domain S-box-containing protein